MLIQHGNKLFSLCYFADAHACLTDAVAGFADDIVGFVDDVLSRPDDDHCRRDKHDVFIDTSPCL